MKSVYNDQMVFNHILRSNIPREEKSTIRRWFDSLTGGKATEVIERYGLDKPADTTVTVGEVIVAGSEAMGVGGVLGAMHAMLKDGLDQKIPFTNTRVAVDGALGGVGLVGAVLSPVAKEHLKNIGTSATAVYGFRKFHDMLAAKRSISKIEGEENGTVTSEKLDDEEPAPGDIGEDPIVTLSNSLES